MSCDMRFQESAIVAQYAFGYWTSFYEKFEKMSTDFSDNANKTTVFVSGSATIFSNNVNMDGFTFPELVLHIL